MKLNVVIVSYNVKDFLHQCLLSVEKAAKGIDTLVYVVDNCSQDGSVEYLRRLHPQVRFIENQENLGFARANNKAIRQSDGEYVLLLNPDTILTEHTLHECIAFMDTHSEVGCVGVKQLKSDGSFALESRRGVPTPFTAFCKMSGLCSLFPKNRKLGRYYMQYLDADQQNEIEIVSGAFMFLRRSALNESGYLDEDFFMYGEDIDLSYRLLKRGWENWYLPTPILHYKGESTNKSSYRYVHVFYEAMLIFFRKHYGHLSILYSLPVKFAILVKGALAYLTMRLRRHVDERKERTEYLSSLNWLFIGSEADYQELSQLCRHNGINLRWMDENIEGGPVTQREAYQQIHPEYVIFNAESTSYQDILTFFEQSSHQDNGSKKKQSHPLIATYYPSTRQVISPGFIVEEKE